MRRFVLALLILLVTVAASWLIQKRIQREKADAAEQSLRYAKPTENEKTLRRIIQQNPHHDVQGKAAFALAELFRGQNNRQAAEQEFQTVIAQYGDVQVGRRTLAEVADGELFEMRCLSIGQVAPNIVGTDADGQRFQLTDYRGKVIVLEFWGEW